MEEMWKGVFGYEGLYEVSSFGAVKSIGRNKSVGNNGGIYNLGDILLKPRKSRGYNVVVLCKLGKTKNFLVHRLVAGAFLENKDNKATVNHINGNKTDNRLENLEWATSSEQQRHALSTGLRDKTKGEKSNLAKLKEEDIFEIRRLYKTGFYRMGNIAKKFNIAKNTVNSIVHSYTWKHLGGESIKNIDTSMIFPSRFKIKLEDLPVIWHLHFVQNMNYIEIGRIFNCCRKTISKVVKNNNKYLTIYNNAQYQ